MLNFKKILGIRTNSDKVSEYRSLCKSLEAFDVRGEQLAEQYSLQKSYVTNLHLIPEEKRGDVIKSYGEFIHQHNTEVIQTMNERNALLKSIDKLRKGSAGPIIRRIELFNQLRKSHESGNINQELYFKLMKSLGGGKIRYSDVVAINDMTGDFLVLHRVKDDLSPEETVCIPGGHVDPGETFQEAAIRELKEETNLDPMKDRGIQELGVYQNDDCEIHYFLVVVDHNQPVVCEASENIWSEWIMTGEIPFKKFIYDQGKNIYNLLTKPCSSEIKPIENAYEERRMSCDAMVEGVSTEICKAFGLNYQPLMPESLEGGNKKVRVAVRDPYSCLEGVCKSISGSSVVTLCGQEISFNEPIMVHGVSYSKDPKKGRLCDFELIYSGDVSDVKKLFENITKLGIDSKVEVKTPHEEFLSANEKGIGYVGEPVFLD